MRFALGQDHFAIEQRIVLNPFWSFCAVQGGGRLRKMHLITRPDIDSLISGDSTTGNINPVATGFLKQLTES